MSVSVASPRGKGAVAAPLRALALAALALEGRRAGEIGVVLADDERLRELNRAWRGLDRATDVLSFSYDDGEGEVADGDIVISLERVAVQAKRFRTSPGRELARLVVHGALHLAGLDHATVAERRRMRAREGRVLRAGREAIAELETALGVSEPKRAARPAGKRGVAKRPVKSAVRAGRKSAAKRAGTRRR
jgi:probable rRNA maturation factor